MKSLKSFEGFAFGKWEQVSEKMETETAVFMMSLTVLFDSKSMYVYDFGKNGNGHFLNVLKYFKKILNTYNVKSSI